MLPLDTPFNLYLHLVVKFVQAIGLVAAGVATEFFVSRWYGIGERGKMLGIEGRFFPTAFGEVS